LSELGSDLSIAARRDGEVEAARLFDIRPIPGESARAWLHYFSIAVSAVILE
jgi:hypothetical protein